MAELILQYNVGPENRVELTSTLRSGDGQETLLPAAPNVCYMDELQELSVRINTTLCDAMPVLATEDEGGRAQADIEALQKLGTELGRMVLPHEILQRLHQDHSIRHIVFRHNPLLNGVPFHAAYFDSDFLCFQYAVAKQLLNSAARSAGPEQAEQTDAAFKAFSLINPDGSLPPSAKESFNAFRSDWMRDDTLAGRIDFTDARISRSIKPQKALTSLQNVEVVLLNCHHIYDEERPENSGFVLAQGQHDSREVLTALDLMDRFGSAVRPPRLILSLSCDSGITAGWEAQWPNTPTVYGMVDALQRIGVFHYVGSICPIPAAHAPKVITPFFRSLADGHTVGEAMRQAREALRPARNDVLNVGTVLGLSLVLYGRPSKACFCADGHRVDVSPTVECTAVDQDSGIECGRIVCPRDAGFGQRRCSIHRKDKTIKCSAGHIVGSLDDLNVCNADACANTFCNQCSGSAHSLCWHHACYSNGLPVASVYARKTCQGHTHHGEKRTVCPTDAGWLRGLCADCLKQLPEDGHDAEVPVCSHCGRFVDDGNGWKGVCHICGQRTCAGCEHWHEQTLYCSNPNQADRDAKLRTVLQESQSNDPDVLSHEKLEGYGATAKSFRDGLSLNLNAYAAAFGKIPRLTERMRDLFLPRPRTLKLHENLHCAKGKWLPPNLPPEPAASAGLWNWPAPKPGAGGLWQPPQDWEALLENLNQIQVNKLQPAWGPPVLVAVVTLAPLRFEKHRGPVAVPAAAGHIQKVWDVLEDWWNAHQKKPMPDTYMAAFSATGWQDHLTPGLPPHRAEFLFAPAANTFAVRRPPLAGIPPHVRNFASYLRPQTTHQRLQHIFDWTKNYLNTWDSLTWDVAQREVAKKHGFQPTADEVVTAFDELAETAQYTKHEVNGKPALRPATASEQGRELFRRRRVEIASTCTGVILSISIWQLRGFSLVYLPDHWASVVGATLVTVLLCNGIGRLIKYFSAGKTA